MADITFYSTVAQVVPVLFLAVAIDRDGFTRSLTRTEVKRLIEDERRPAPPDSARHVYDAMHEYIAEAEPEMVAARTARIEQLLEEGEAEHQAATEHKAAIDTRPQGQHLVDDLYRDLHDDFPRYGRACGA
jgi:hypothetical protein